MVNGTTPTSFAPETINGILWPTGLLPNLANQLSDIALVRSMQCARAGAFAGADVDADRTQSGGGARQHRAQYRQRGGHRKG